MTVDCAIIGGGPAGLSAALVMGRARRKIILFDDNNARNAVTQHSHGFITRDGVTPAEFRASGQQDIAKYSSVEIKAARIAHVTKQASTFELVTTNGEKFEANNIILATGIQETLPAVEGIYDYYGKSLFNCPFCDGWELRDKPLVVIAETELGASHLPKVLYNWSRDLVVCTNGHQVLTEEQKQFYAKYDIRVIEDKITALVGQAGQLEQIVFEYHPTIERAGGLVAIQWKQANTLAQELGCATNAQGGIATDEAGHTNIKGVYAAGDTVTTSMQSQLIIAAANGSKAAFGVNADMIAAFFEQ